MQVGLIGAGRMGAGMAARMLDADHDVVVYDNQLEAARRIEGARVAMSVEELAALLSPPRAVLLMLPPGAPTRNTLDRLERLLDPADVVADGGNNHYGDARTRAEAYRERGLGFVDLGTSGGLAGASTGYCVLAGGELEHVRHLWPALEAIAAEGGLAHVGPIGSGQFAKMVHNAVVYGLMQAYAEGYELLAVDGMEVDVDAALKAWASASVSRSFLLDRIVEAAEQDPGFAHVEPWVDDTGMGRWSVIDGVHFGVPTPVLTGALYIRFLSRQESSPAMRMLASLRRVVGGHPVRTHG